MHNNRQIIINLDVVVNLALKPRLGGLDSTGFLGSRGPFRDVLPKCQISWVGKHYLPEV